MPNWVTNNVTVVGKDNVKKFKEAFGVDFDEEFEAQDFSFTKVIPMPEELRIEAGWSTYDHLRKGKEPDRTSAYAQSRMELILEENYNKRIPQDKFAKIICHRVLANDILKKQIKNFEPSMSLSDKELDDLISGLAKSYFNLKRFGFTDWYSWSIANWGTKWDACEPMISDFDTTLHVSFDTAWATPEKVFKALADKGIDFKVTFADEDLGNNLGLLVSSNGKLEFVDLTEEYDSIAVANIIKGNDYEYYSEVATWYDDYKALPIEDYERLERIILD